MGDTVFAGEGGEDPAEPENEGDDSIDEEVDQDTGRIEEPETRAAFNALRGSYKSTFDFVNALYAERGLQLQMRMIIDASLDLRAEYAAHLKSEGEGQMDMLQFAMERSTGAAWFPTIVSMLQRFSSQQTVDRLQLTPPAFNQSRELEDLENDADLKAEVELLSKFAKLITSVAGHRAWSQSFYSLTFPYCGARLMSKDLKSINLVRKLADGILQLKATFEANPRNTALRELLSDIGTNYWVLTREMFACGRDKGWSVDDNTELRELCFSLFGGPNSTKNVLESTFSHVKDAFLRYNRNMRQGSSAAKWMYASTCSYPAQGGLRQFRLDEEDFLQFVTSSDLRKAWKTSSLFDPSHHSIADVVPNPQDIKREARKASHTANPASAAAGALVLFTMDRNFNAVGDSWAGFLI